MTPNPHEHAVYANKCNLAVLCDPEPLAAFGIDPATATLARGIPFS